jgi:hypothetical protein
MAATAERTFRTRGAEDSELPTMGVYNVACDVKKITTTNEGAISIAIELSATSNEVLEQVRDLIRIQQGRCMLSISGIQGELPL